MRLILLAPVCLALFAGGPDLVRQVDELVQLRLKTPIPGVLGMSRIAAPSSMGGHFHPVKGSERDFVPENVRERETIARLEKDRVEVGLYVFGKPILKTMANARDYRALKGPAIVTRGTPRPGMRGDALPDWDAVYPVARRAMERFQKGGGELVTVVSGWEVLARAVTGDKRCEVCHAPGLIGGVVYAFREAGAR